MTDISGNQGRNSAKVLWGSREPELKREQVVLLMISKGSWEHVSPWEGLLFFPSMPTAHVCYRKQILRLPNLTSAALTGKTNTTFSLSLLHLL